jgi:transposase
LRSGETLIKRRIELDKHPEGFPAQGRHAGQERLRGKVRELVDGDAVLTPVVAAILGVRREFLQRLDDLRPMSVPGVGRVTALAFRTAIENPARFAKSSLVGSYFGLTPRKYASGETDRNGSSHSRRDLIALRA